MRADVLIVGGGLAGGAAAATAAQLGLSVILIEELEWLGGQVTAQGVPFDEHPWNETVMWSRSYWGYRERIRDYYRQHMPLTAKARQAFPLNPGMGRVSSLCHEPRVSVRVIDDLLAPYTFGARLRVLKRHRLMQAHLQGDRIEGVTVRDLERGRDIAIAADIFIDASETGILIDAAQVEHVVGAESRSETGELHALEQANPRDQAGMTWCVALDYLPDEDHTIERPATYDFWREYRPLSWPGPLLSFTSSDHFTHKTRHYPLFDGDSDRERAPDLWHFRRIAYRRNFEPGTYASDVTIACWGMNEYLLRPMIGIPPDEEAQGLAQARAQTLSMVYWLQTEAPRHDGGAGYRGLRPRGDVLGTADGLAMQPYYREGRRIRAELTVVEEDFGVEARPGRDRAKFFDDSIGLGAYRMNIHPTTGGANSFDIPTYPYQIPLGAMLPVRIDNMIAGGCKLVGSTRLTTSSYRHHPIDWTIGEAAGALAAVALQRGLPPRAIRARHEELRAYQARLSDLGVMLRWPDPLSMIMTYAQGADFARLFHETQGTGRFPDVG